MIRFSSSLEPFRGLEVFIDALHVAEEWRTARNFFPESFPPINYRLSDRRLVASNGARCEMERRGMDPFETDTPCAR